MEPKQADLFCPYCHRRHVDEGEWANRPHTTHLCTICKEEFDVSHPQCYGRPGPDITQVVKDNLMWRFVYGEVPEKDYHSAMVIAVDKWHRGEGLGEPIFDYLGMTSVEYGRWVTQGDAVLPEIVHARRVPK